ncbi:DNA-directed RNA polymerase subunit D [Candidatus Micrarchaeota archaeon]|nr:DNA-directed RNA polymerase subunit D [Candidatus Micrarchaeota archaeon]
MEIEVVAEEHKKLYLLVDGASTAFLNALRRAVIASLTAYAIDKVDFYENTSPMFNEYVANRIGLVPLTFEESASGDVSFSLDAEAVEEEKTIYSGDLVSQDPAIKAFYLHVPIVKLGKGQRLRFEATARVGKGREHAKFQSALSSYGSLDEIKLVDACKKCGRQMKCREPFLKDKIPASKLPELCTVCEDCESKVQAKKNEHILFFVESFNNISARQQLFRALASLVEEGQKVKEVLKA